MAKEPGTLGNGLEYGALGHSLGFLLRLSQIQNFAGFYDALGPLGIRPGELSVLMMIRDNPGVRQGVLAKALMIKRAHMAKMVRVLEDKQMITRSVPEDDRRAYQLWLSDHGTAWLAQIDAPFRQFESGDTGGLTGADRAALIDLLRKNLGLTERSQPNEKG